MVLRNLGEFSFRGRKFQLRIFGVESLFVCVFFQGCTSLACVPWLVITAGSVAV